MPPKKAPAPSKKVDAKKKEKIIEDKTFGLKNKKGAKQQKFVQQVSNQVKFGNNPKKTKDEKDALTKKEEKQKQLAEMNQLFKPVVAAQKIDKGVDPKSVLCAFFKSGQCGKGAKCKFSHDLTIERKSEKKSLYFDKREGEEGEGEADNMDNWDDDKLKEVVEKKHGERERKLPPTDIICKHFLEAVESNKYGWFWECPGGGEKCHYRHALPPGFVLKKDRKNKDKVQDITIEELVEIERSNLGYNLTKITLESFLEWKKKKVAEKQAASRKETDRRKAEFKAGKNVGLSGREMFTFNPELATDNDMEEGEAAMDIVREREDDDDETGLNVKEIDLEAIAREAKEVDHSAGTTQAAEKRDFATKGSKAPDKPSTSKEGDAAGGPSTTSTNGDAGGEGGEEEEEGEDDIINEPIDETLFAEDDDLDGLEDELNAAAL
ncbi:hypothetical protein TYRP_014957 [Tyrophagus putrescentiae]|nr:hypothetical protein TYRP_014957 [Tyrophagus putrescentiae]